MSETNKVIADLLDLCRAHGVRRLKKGDFEAEFFAPSAEPMALDAKTLSNILSDSMPPDSVMLFASSEGVPDFENLKPQQRDDDTMT